MCSPPPDPYLQLPLHLIPLGCNRAPALGALLHALNSPWSSTLHMIIYMFQCYSLKSSHPHFSPLSPKGYSIQLCLLCCPACRLISPIFLNSIYMVCPWNSPGKNTEVVCHSLLQEIFLTQGSDLGLLYCRQIFYHLSYKGSPYICVNIQYLSFIFLTYFTLYDRHQDHPPH